MKKFILILFLGVASSLKAQITYDFTTASPSSGVPQGWTVSDVTVGNTSTSNASLLASSSASSGYSGVSGGNNGSISAKDGALSKATSSYFQFTLTPTSNNVVRLAGISFGTRSTASGPTSYAIYSSLDNYSTSILSGTLNPNSIWVLVSQSFSGVEGAAGSPVTLRIYGSGGSSASAGNWRLDDVYLALGSVLPVSLISFIAEKSDKGVRLKWTTAAEINSKQFEIRKSSDGISFSSVGIVAAAENSSTKRSYSFLDQSFANGRVYYQLTQQDMDGRSTYSQVITVNQSQANTIQPLVRYSALVGLEINSDEPGAATIQISDVQGKILQHKSVQLITGKNEISFDDISGNKIVIIRVSGISGTVSKKYFIE